jgi:hypothetical protein
MPTQSPPQQPSPPHSQGGFALVVTISLMVLLAIIAVGLLSLSAISLRTSSQGSAQAEARANSRLALMLAVGALQKHAGPDTRITAPSSIIDENSPPLIGSWRAWEGTNHETSGNFAGRPITPDYASKKKPAENGGRFLNWLVSGTENRNPQADPANLAHKSPTGKSIPMLSGGTLAKDDQNQVHLIPSPVKSGSLAWWVSGENQKARLPRHFTPDDKSSPAQWSVIAKSHAVADPEPFKLETLLEKSEPADKAITLRSAHLIAGGSTSPLFHDLSATSVGLLTNSATGGWRKDFSLLSENWSSQSVSKLPFFRITPNTDTSANRPTESSPNAQASMLYPWASYRGSLSDPPIYQHGAVSSWANLIDWATYYKNKSISANASGRITADPFSMPIDAKQNSDKFNFLHRVRVLPLIARMHWVFSHSAEKGTGLNSDKYEPRLLLTPAITMWNPYNIQITSPKTLRFSVPRPIPTALRYTIGGQANPNFNAVMGGANLTNNSPALGSGTLNFTIDSAFTLKPGEALIFSPQSNTPVASTASIALASGYRSGGGHYFSVKGASGQDLLLAGGAEIKAEAKFDTAYKDHGNNGVATGVGIYLDMLLPDGLRHLVYRMVYLPEMANAIYPPLSNLASTTLSECFSNPRPFLSTIFGARTASNTHLAAKGFVQSSPLVNYTAMGKKDEEERTIARHYGGTGHPVNSPFDYSFVTHASGGDSLLPNVQDKSGRGYIITGFNSGDGLSRCVIAELPVRPVASLGELVNWDLRYENPIPPFAINLIGNSDASPLLPPDKVVNSNDAGLAVNLQYDDSYCANHLLFDDWFVSSIAPNPTNFGSSGRSLKDTHSAFVTGATPLANRSYQPIREDRATTPSQASAIYQKQVDPASSWRTIASRLEVEGMFNVNSTSVTAWRALLGHAREQLVPHIKESGTTWSAGLSRATDYPWSRFTIAGDTEAGTAGSSGTFPEATHFAGYRTVDDDFLDQLSKEVVNQIRRRGPFLSLSEFVNRQLSSGELALAGTLQAALNKLSEKSSTDPFAEIKTLSSPSIADPPSPATAPYDEEYKFREAAVGHSAYGLPGWTRQADILRPLAPILSARDDTFTVRAYGDARDKSGNVIARAWCEATVRRTRDFVDPAEAADLTTAPALPANAVFGRRFDIVSFRWLSPDEV